jgi:hypothetical protein
MVMSRQTVSKTVAVLGRSIFALGFALCALQSCGSSSSGDTTAVCNQACNRESSCTEADGGPSSADAMSNCMTICAAQKCTNESALLNAVNTCLGKSSCSDFVSCTAAMPQCQMATSGSGGTGAATGGTNGGGGATGSGGTTGAGGTTGTGSCADCDKAAACCAAIATMAGLSSSAAGCDAYSTSMCNTSGQDQSLEAQACTAILQGGAAENIAACK